MEDESRYVVIEEEEEILNKNLSDESGYSESRHDNAHVLIFEALGKHEEGTLGWKLTTDATEWSSYYSKKLMSATREMFVMRTCAHRTACKLFSIEAPTSYSMT